MSKARPEDHIWGVDPAQEMLFLAQKKIGALTNITLQAGDACDLKFENNFFDIITIAFGIRNILDTNKALGEIKRVLKPGGRLCVLEFSLPTNFFIKLGYLAYFRHILPKLGGLISGDRRAYEYLNKTVEAFYTPQKFSQILKSAGFTINKITSLSAGIATLYEAGNA